MEHAYICDAIRTPFGRYGGTLSGMRADDLGALPLKALMARNPNVDWGAIDDVIYGCANQAGEDNRNVARMSALLAGLPVSVPGTTMTPVAMTKLPNISAHSTGGMALLIPGGLDFNGWPWKRRSRTPAPSLVWMGGFRSDMTSTKAEKLDEAAAAEGFGMLRFDYQLRDDEATADAMQWRAFGSMWLLRNPAFISLLAA